MPEPDGKLYGVDRMLKRIAAALLLLAACGTAKTEDEGAPVDPENGGKKVDGSTRASDAEAGTSRGDAATGSDATTGSDAAQGCPDAGAFGGRTFAVHETTLYITAGGTYENLVVTSPDSDSPAIEVETTSPVVLRHVRGSGPGNFVHAGGGSAVTIENSMYVATAPSRDDVRRGRFYAASSPVHVAIEHCSMDHTSGIEVQSFAGDGSAAQTVRVRYNEAREIDGRFRNGGSEQQDFVGLSAGKRASAEISYNRIVTTPGQGRAEDIITMYKNGGTATRPYRVYRNYIEGTYRDAYLGDTTTGTAINADGDAATTDADFPQYGIWEENVATGGAAINVAVGRHMRVNRNTVVAVGRNRFGTRYRNGRAGISLFNYIGSPLYVDNSGDGNRILWLSDEAPVRGATPYSTVRRDVDQGAGFLTGTVALSLAYDVAEETVHDDYMQLLASSNVTLGPSWCP